MVRFFLPLLAVLALATSGTQAADTPAATPAPAAAPAPAATAAAAPSIEERLAAIEKTVKVCDDSRNQIAFNAGDNAWMLTSTLLVLLMTLPGLALFYGGLVRRKNVLGTMMQSVSIAAVISLLWCVFGYAVAFGDGESANSIWGGLKSYVMLDGVVWKDGKLFSDPNGNYAMSIPHGTFMLFQLMFAIITPALIAGAYAERMKFSSMMVFNVLWFCIVYLPMAHMVWGAKGLFNWWAVSKDGLGWAAFDFAGGTVVHISSGIAALMAAIILGKRKNYLKEPMPPHNLTYSFIGACLLWVGWFGFNAGSALSAGGLATLAFSNTHFATAGAAITWPLAEWLIRGKPTVLGAVSGAVAGLVAITPAAGFVSPGAALVIGLVAGALCFSAASYLKHALGYDDALDAFGVHGVGGMWGAIATGLFFQVDANPGVAGLTSTAVNADFSGLYEAIKAGTHSVVAGQIKAVLITVLFSAIASSVILLAIKYTIGLRVKEEEETEGLDLSQHGEEGYNLT